MGPVLSKGYSMENKKKEIKENLIRSLREKNGMRQVDLARELGISQPTVSRMEREKPVELINQKLKAESYARRQKPK